MSARVTLLLRLSTLLMAWSLSVLVSGQSSFYVRSPTVSRSQVRSLSVARLSSPSDGSTGCAAAAAPESPPAALPLRATNLAARRDDGTQVTLTWEVDYSDEAYRWSLERRLDLESDFREIRELSTELLLRRKYPDRNPHPGTSYYRLRGVAADGAESVSRIQAVDNGFDPPAFHVFPNPLRRSASVVVPGTERAFTLELSDQLGRRVWLGRYPTGAANPVAVTLPKVPPGVYLLRWAAKDAPGKAVRVVIGY